MNIAAGVDLNKSALKTFTKNFPEAEAIEGSVRSKTVLKKCAMHLRPIEGPTMPSLVVSGPPCQGFSVAGPRKATDPRNQILVAVARAIVKVRPDCALIENVSMVLAHKYSSRLKKFKGVLAGAGYHVSSVLLNASEFGVSQKRKRAFFLVTRKPLKEQKILALLEAYKIVSSGAQEALKGLPTAIVRPDDYNDENNYGIIANHIAMQHSKPVIEKIAAIPPGTGPMSYRRLHPERLSNTLISGHRAPPAHFQEPRSITVREAARLQGFPDTYRIYGSFGKQMEQVTNAVPPPLAKAVLQVLLQLTNIQCPAS